MNNIFKTTIAIIFLLSFSSCYKDFERRISGNGNMTTVTRPLGNFEEVHSSGSFNIEIINDTVSRVEIEAESNIIDIIETRVSGKELEIDFADHTSLITHKSITIKVHTKKLSGISLSGSGTINAGSFSGNTFNAHLSGSGTFTFDFIGSSVNYSISGSGKINATGKASKQEVKVSGSGAVNALDLESENTVIDISGSGDAKIFCTKSLNAGISGSGSVIYKGSPAIIGSISGSGKLKPY